MAVADALAGLADKLPPQNLDAERSVLGCMMLDNDVIDEIADIIQPRNFYLHAHQKIAEAIFGIYESTAGGVDPVTTAEELERRSELEEIGGPAYLAEILETVPHTAHAKHYARIVSDKWTLRSLRNTCGEILRDVEDESLETGQILSQAEQKIFSILEIKGEGENYEIREILMQTMDAISERWLNDGRVPGVSTGFQDLDKKTNGLHGGELIILAARPSMGKTAFVCNLAVNVAHDAHEVHNENDLPHSETPKGGVLFFSLEQSKMELSERFLCIHGKLDGHRLKQGKVDDAERDQVMRAASQLSEFPIFIDDQSGRSMSEIAAISRRLKRKHDIEVIVIDYLQLIEPDDPRQPREQQVSNIARRLKFLAKDINVPVISLAQLNRGVELRENKQPRLADLRESGAIEQDADLVFFLHRPDAYDPEDRPGEAELIVAKHRNGPVGVVNLTWLKESMKFADYSTRMVPEDGYFDQTSGFTPADGSF